LKHPVCNQYSIAAVFIVYTVLHCDDTSLQCITISCQLSPSFATTNTPSSFNNPNTFKPIHFVVLSSQVIHNIPLLLLLSSMKHTTTAPSLLFSIFLSISPKYKTSRVFCSI